MHTHLLLWKYARLRGPRSLFRVQWLGALVAGTIQASSRENRLLKNAAVFEKNVLRFNHFFRKLAKMRYGHIFYYHPVYSESTFTRSIEWSSIIYTTFYQRYQNMFRDRLQNGLPGSVTRVRVCKWCTVQTRPGSPARFPGPCHTWLAFLMVQSE